MVTSKRPRRTPGFEPALGNADPNAVAAAPLRDERTGTHHPSENGNGPVCGLRPAPTDASAYAPENPTCPGCVKWLAAAKKVTARIESAGQRAPAAQPAQQPSPKGAGG